MQEKIELYYLHCKDLKEDGLALEELNNYANFKNVFSKYEFECILKEKQNRKNKRYRTKSKFKEILTIKDLITNENKKIIFGTITLDNKHLNQKENTYIRKIHKWLKKHFIYSILNKDYGSQTEREHYHFIGLTIEEIEYTGKISKKGNKIYELVKKDYDMGFEPDLCIIDLKINDIEQTVNYLLKLNNHSNKITSRNRTRIIKNTQYDILSLEYGFEATRGEKTLKKRLLESM